MKRLLTAVLAGSLLLACVPLVKAKADGDSRIKVACVGDSITQGIGSTNLRENTYPAHLQQFLNKDKYLVGNFGASGRTAIKDAGTDVYVPYWNDGNFEKSKAFEPNMVILMLGTNDVMCTTWNVNAYYEGIKGLIETYKALPTSPQVYVCTPMAAFDTAHPDKLAEGIPYLKQAAADTGATVVDVNTLTADWMEKQYINGGNDLVHPTDSGYLAFAQLLYEEIFHGKTVTVTVTADEGCTVSMGGQKVKETGTLLTGWDGTDGDKKELTVEKPRVGLTKVIFASGNNPTVDLRGAVLPQNVAYTATAMQAEGLDAKLAHVNDGNTSTGWQPGWGASYADMWVGYDFGENKVFDTVTLLWEGATRAPADGYTLEFSADGRTWGSLDNVTYSYGTTEDTVKFPAVSGRYVRVKITKGTNGTWRPQIYEMRVTKDVDPFTPAVTYEETDSKGKDKAGLPSYGKYAVAAGAVAVAAGVVGLLVSRRKKKRDN